jgi:photosystem II stability/assembly factor-like uncharacterized protein
MVLFRSIERGVLVGLALSALLGATACKKKSGGPGGSWLVGENGFMGNLREDGSVGEGYDLESDDDLLDIVCRGADTAFVVGEAGTMLRTFDGGATWESLDLGTRGTLRSVATAGPDLVYVAGEGVLKASPDSGATWRDLGADPSIAWQGVAAGHEGSALALSSTGAVWRAPAGASTLTQVGSLPQGRAVAMSHDGAHAAVVGAGRSLLRSDDAGERWRSIDLGRDVDLYGAWVTESGDLIAAGAGVIVRVSATDEVSISAPTTATLRTLHINHHGHGLAAGDGGTVLMTHDGGASWTTLELGYTSAIFGVDEVAGDGHL